MALVKADLHIHTFLSPCGDIEMTPCHIVQKALERGMGLIAITDHNTTAQAPEIQKVGLRCGLPVLVGAEVTTREEVHCVVLVGDETQRLQLQAFLEEHLPPIPNNPDFFGYQIQVDEHEEVVAEAPYLLISALDCSINNVEAFVHSIGGLFIPAHIDKPRDSVISQLGFVPPDLNADALELSRKTPTETFVKEHRYLAKTVFLHSSDAHLIEDVGITYTLMDLPEVTFHGLDTWLHTAQTHQLS